MLGVTELRNLLCHEKWKKSNRISLMIIKRSMTDVVRGYFPHATNAKDFLKFIEEKYKESPKTETASPSLGNSSSEEDRAIAEKGFYLHPSSRATTTPRDQEPRLLPLFSVTSPRVSGSSS
ncbi:hypothetical protein ACFX13_013849 [Malus domestica]